MPNDEFKKKVDYAGKYGLTVLILLGAIVAIGIVVVKMILEMQPTK